MSPGNRYHGLLIAVFALVRFGFQLDDQVITFAVFAFEVHGRAHTFQFTGRNDRQTIAEQISLVQMMRRENNGAAGLVLEDEIPDSSTSERIDT